MEDNNRINRRSRPRPYDLRRKVLLKNFLREQMTHIPFPEIRIESTSHDNNNNFTEESPVSIHLDEDISELSEDLSENTQNSPSLGDNIEPDPIVADSKDVLDNVVDKSVDSNSPVDSSSDSNMLKFASLVKFKKESKKSFKGILKAKDVCKSVKSPMRTRSFKSGLERVFYGRKRSSESTPMNQKSRNSPRSLFSLFKHRKEQRTYNEVANVKKSTCSNLKTSNMSKCNTLNQSIQTDDSFIKEELIRVQESNKRLKEENRLLSESLSYFMSNASMDSQVKHCNSPLQSSNKNLNSTIFPDYYVSSSNSSSVNPSWNPRSRITRSKSVQEYNERRNMPRNNYRTRSMNYHNYRNNLLPTDIKPSMSAHNVQSQAIHIPRVRRKNTVNLPISSSIRGIQRRSSMPERILSENDRSVVCRRTGSFRDTHTRKPFNSLPSEAFY